MSRNAFSCNRTTSASCIQQVTRTFNRLANSWGNYLEYGDELRELLDELETALEQYSRTDTRIHRQLKEIELSTVILAKKQGVEL